MKPTTLTKIAGHLALTALAGLVIVGCASAPSREPVGPYQALTHSPVLEDSETLVLLDAGLQSRISVEGQRASFDGDGRLVAEAKIRNLTPANYSVQVQTVFKDEAGMSSGDESAWQTLLLNPNAMETYRCSALNAKSAKYTIRIRTTR